MVPSYTSDAMPTALAQRRMRVDGGTDIAGFGAHLDRQCKLRDQVARVHADDAAADDAVRLLVEDQLGEAFAATDADRACRCRPRELAHADMQALGLRLGLGHADPGDLGIGVSHRGHHACDPFALLAGGDFRRELAFVRGLVRQHRLADQIADGEDVRHVGAHLPVDRDEAAFGDLHAGLVGVDPVAVRRATDRDQHAIPGARLQARGTAGVRRLERHGDALLRSLDLRGLGLQVHGDALLLQAVVRAA